MSLSDAVRLRDADGKSVGGSLREAVLVVDTDGAALCDADGDDPDDDPEQSLPTGTDIVPPAVNVRPSVPLSAIDVTYVPPVSTCCCPTT